MKQLIHRKIIFLLLIIGSFLVYQCSCFSKKINDNNKKEEQSSCFDLIKNNLPDHLDSDFISYCFEQNDFDGLYNSLTAVFNNRERRYIPALSKSKENQKQYLQLPDQIVARGGGSSYTTEYKLSSDVEQLKYLLNETTSSLTDEDTRELIQNTVIPAYEQILDKMPSLDRLLEYGTEGLYPFQKFDKETLNVEDLYNKAFHLTQIDELDATGKPIEILNYKMLDIQKIQDQFEEGTKGNINDGGQQQDYPPGIIVIDNILSDEALRRIRKVMLESTVFYQTKMPLKFGGYAGAYIDDGLHDKILLALSFELHKAFPRIMKDHPLKYLWSYKYDSEFTGINTHADQAAVNVNIWLTPDDANLDKDSGGLVVYTAKPPPGWDFEQYNTNTELVIEDLIKPSGYANVTIPFRYNRAVLFDSALFHHTDKFKFKGGYSNRRINLTLLYGDMNKEEIKKKSRNDNRSEL